jgi:hypothetical protein
MAEYLVGNKTTGAPQRANALKTSAGAADADKIVATGPNGTLDPTVVNASATGGAGKIVQYGSDGRLSKAVMPAGYEQTGILYVAAEALAAGDSVNVHTAGGLAKVRKADASTNKEAHGFVDQAYTNGATGVMVLSQGVNTNASGLTPGARVYQSSTPGLATTALPSDTAMWQVIGQAVDATSYDFTFNLPILPPAA